MAHGERGGKWSARADWLGIPTAGLILLFVVLSYTAALTKSPTYDEPLHVLSTWVYRYAGDYTIVCDHPPLWVYWASLPMKESDLRVDTHSASWRENTDQMRTEDTFAFNALYADAGVDSVQIVQRARAMMVILGGLLGALLAIWAWQLGGPVASFFTAAFFAFDPGFLGHAPLVKNDVAAALATVALLYATWRIGRRATWLNLTAAALLCGAAINTKLSLLPLGPLVAALLAIRALQRTPWPLFGRIVSRRVPRLLVVAGMLLVMVTTSVAFTWAMYRFRFEPSPDASVTINTAGYLNDVRVRSLMARHTGTMPTPAELADWKPPTTVSAILWAIDHRILPSAWLHGLLFVYSHSIIRSTYLLGVVGSRSPWCYVPVEILVKTPVGTLLAIVAAIVAAIVILMDGRERPGLAWSGLCVLAPPTLLFGAAMASSLGIGLRHVLPAWAFVLLALGVAAEGAITRWGSPATIAFGVLWLATAVETARASPDFIAFFNRPAGGERGGLALLGDSNLDWGQDLPQLARWQQTHDDRPLYLMYTGTAEPAAYGVHYRVLRGDPFRPADPIVRPAYAAISATALQGIYFDGDLQRYYARFRALKPLAVLGGTIYVYEMPAD